MTRRAKIVVGVVELSAVVLAGSAIAQATSSHTPKEQRIKPAHPASVLHRQLRGAKSAKVKESRSVATHAQAQTTTQDSRAETEQPESVGPEAVDDSPEVNDDDDQAIENEQVDDDQDEHSDDDDQGEQEDASADDQDDDSSQANVEDDDDSSGQADDGHEDEDAGDD